METITPATIRRPFANYSHGIVVPAGSRLLFASGQLGITAEDHIPEDAGAQAELCFRAATEIGERRHDGYRFVRINAL